MNQYDKNTWAMTAMDEKQKAEWLERMERLSVKDDEAIREAINATSDIGAKQSTIIETRVTLRHLVKKHRFSLVVAITGVVISASMFLCGTAPQQDKYSAARKRLSVPEIVLPDISILKPSHILSTLADDTMHIKNTIAAIDSELTAMSVAKDTVGVTELRETRDWFQSLIAPPHHWHGDTLIH